MKSAWFLVAMWVVVNLAGWVVGLAASTLLVYISTVIPGVDEDRIFGFILLPVTGLAIGIAQGRVIPGLIPKPSRWVVATVAGYLIGLILDVGMTSIWGFLKLQDFRLWNGAILLGLLGSAIGVTQWLILRQHFRQAWVWVPAMLIGFLVFLILIQNPVHTAGEGILIVTIVGTLASALPGVVLVWLSRRPLIASA